MTEETRAGAAPFAAGEIEALARDWIAIWQSELGSYAGDREAVEAWLRLLGLWAGAATSLLSAFPAAPSTYSPVGDSPVGDSPVGDSPVGAPYEWTDRNP
ncbi:MAG: hypothetical protein ACREFS_07595, partial [Acetobacteraceae bacterium]